MRINHNIAALNTYRQLGAANNAQQSSMEKLSSGLRINKAGDDAAGLAISEKMRGQIRGLEQAQSNAQDGISMIQTAEGALNETHSILQRMRELSVQASNDTNTDTDRQELQKEVEQLVTELDRIGNDTEFNTKTLLDGSIGTTTTLNVSNTSAIEQVKVSDNANGGTTAYNISQTLNYAAESSGGAGDGAFQSADIEIYEADGTSSIGTITFSAQDVVDGKVSKSLTDSSGVEFTVELDISALGTGNGAGTESTVDTIDVAKENVSLQIGANAGQSLEVTFSDMRANALGVDEVDLTTHEGANQAITQIDNAIQTVSGERSKLGAYQNRLDHTINNLGTASENLTAAESRIRDVDMAKEMMNQTKNSILSQAAQAMLAQANQQPQGVLQLLR
jgi:flagellin